MDNKENNLEIYRLKYTILRRAICTYCHQGHLTDYHFSREDLEQLCHKIEGKNLKELEEIHKEWIGY